MKLWFETVLLIQRWNIISPNSCKPSPVPPWESEVSLSFKTHKIPPGQFQREGLRALVQANSGPAGHAGRWGRLRHSWRNPGKFNSWFVVQNFQRTSFVSHLWPIVQEGKHIVGRVLGVHRSLLKEVAGAVRSLLKVFLLSRLNVVIVDRDEVVPVRPRVLVDEAESVKQLVDRSHYAGVETGSETNWCYIFPSLIWWSTCSSSEFACLQSSQHRCGSPLRNWCWRNLQSNQSSAGIWCRSCWWCTPSPASRSPSCQPGSCDRSDNLPHLKEYM